MKLPTLTHLQFAVLEEIGAAKMSGRELRERLKKNRKIHKSGPAFYQLMSRLEEAEFVEGWYDQKIIEGQIIKQRHYRLLGDGIRALNETRKFYQTNAVGLPATA